MKKNTMGNFLQEIFDPVLKSYDVRCIGEFLYIRLDRERVFEVTLREGEWLHVYDGLQMRIIHTAHGTIHSIYVSFLEIFEKYRNTDTAKKKNVRMEECECTWDEPPVPEDIKALQDTLKQYIKVWE